MNRSISASRVAVLVGDFDRSPAYAGLAEALTLLIGDGRIPLRTRLPSERELTGALGVSRTTVTRAYDALRESGYAEARQGAGTFTRVPGGRSRAHDRVLTPRTAVDDQIDLTCAAATAPPGVAQAYAEAAAELPAHLGGHGYFLSGVPVLQEAIARRFTERGLPTDPDQVVVTPGALAGAAVVARALTGPGDRVLVESPVYPNGAEAMRVGGARLAVSPVDDDGWDLDAVGAALRQTGPRLAYLIPDFQNPTGLVMSDDQRAEYAAHLRRAGSTAVVDEAHVDLVLDDRPMPAPFASHAPDSLTLGSASKSFWGGLRLGWVRAPRRQVDTLLRARLALDLGAPVMEQLVLVRLLARADDVLAEQRARLRTQRDRLAAALARELPEWRFRLPGGGLALWCELPAGSATAVADEAERHGLTLAPGPVFAPEGGLDRYLRIPWTRPAEELEEAVTRLAAAWAAVGDRPDTDRGRRRVMVA